MSDRMSPALVAQARAMAQLQQQGWTTKEIAAAAHRAPGTVRNLLTALRKLDPTVPRRRRETRPTGRAYADATAAARNPRHAHRNAIWAMRHDAGETMASIAATEGLSPHTINGAIQRHRNHQRLTQQRVNQ